MQPRRVIIKSEITSMTNNTVQLISRVLSEVFYLHKESLMVSNISRNHGRNHYKKSSPHRFLYI